MPKNPLLVNPFKRICKTCGTDITALPLHAHCPACGKAVQLSLLPYRVEGDTLIVKSPVTLPSRCIKTNLPLTKPQKTETLYHYSRLIYLALLLSPLALVITYFIFRGPPVLVTYSITRNSRSHIWIKAALSFLLFLFSWAGCCIATIFDSKPVIFCIMLLGLITLTFVFILLYSSEIGVAKRVGKDEYVLSGVSKEFIEQIRSET